MENDSILQASRYADGEMDKQEQQAFEQQMQADAQLRDYVEQYRQATAALQAHFAPDPALSDLKQTIGTLNQTYFKTEAKPATKPEARVVSMKSYYRWVSGVAAVLIIGLFIFNPWRKSLFEQYNTATTMSVAERGEGTQTNLEKAAAYYNKKEFTNAGSLLAREYAADTTKSLVAYYYAITLVQNKQEAKARTILQALYKGSSAFKYDAAYYIALSYVKQKDNDSAKKWLKLVSMGTANYKKAGELMAKL